MRYDHRPFWVKRGFMAFAARWARYFREPDFDALGPGYKFFKPWYVWVHGGPVMAGANLHIVSARDGRVQLSVWRGEQTNGRISIGDDCLICPAVRISSASEIRIGDGCMLAHGVYVTDADWHDLYDRTQAIGATSPVVIGDNVWLGDSAFVGKGVTIGDNAIIGARAVIVDDVPANAIVAGNPARVVKELDPEQACVTRDTLFELSPEEYARRDAEFDRLATAGNNFVKWLRVALFPRRGD